MTVIEPVKPRGIKFRVVMSDEDFQEVKTLTKSMCANYERGACLPMDKQCLQMACNDGLCNYFKEAVLPLNARLNLSLGQAFANGDKYKACVNCGELFQTTNYKVRLCETCRESNNKERQRRYNRKRSK